MATSITESLKTEMRPLTVKALAERLGVSPRSIYRLVDDNRIPYYVIGTSVRFDPYTVAVWLEGKTQGVSR
jgi:excisionase family DNA binding protein